MSAHLASMRSDLDGSALHHMFLAEEVMERLSRATVAPALKEAPESDSHVNALQLRNEILAMVAHELRAPLTPLRLAAEVIRRASAGQPEVLRMIDMLQRQIDGIARLAEDLMDATRIDRGALRICKGEVDMMDFLIDPIDAAAKASAARGQRFTVEIPDRTLRVECDPLRLSQAVNNLLHNAVKYTPTGGRISFSSHADGKELVLCVRDDGLGISPALLPHVFDLFAQSSRTIAASAGGLGIGLAVVRAVAEAHGGIASASSAGPGAGSEFTLRLPVIAAAQRYPECA